MTPTMMIDRLVERLRGIVSTYELSANVSGVKKAPQVIAGYLPQKKATQKQDIPDFPYVIVRFLKDNDTQELSQVRVKIIVGTYSEDAQNGWRDTLNILTRVKQELLAQPVFGGSFLVNRPIETELPEEQPFPEWYGMLTLNVTVPQMIEEGGV